MDKFLVVVSFDAAVAKHPMKK